MNVLCPVPRQCEQLPHAPPAIPSHCAGRYPQTQGRFNSSLHGMLLFLNILPQQEKSYSNLTVMVSQVF